MPVEGWQGTYDATADGPSCPQLGVNYTSEDCLHLNVYTSKVTRLLLYYRTTVHLQEIIFNSCPNMEIKSRDQLLYSSTQVVSTVEQVQATLQVLIIIWTKILSWSQLITE